MSEVLYLGDTPEKILEKKVNDNTDKIQNLSKSLILNDVSADNVFNIAYPEGFNRTNLAITSIKAVKADFGHISLNHVVSIVYYTTSIAVVGIPSEVYSATPNKIQLIFDKVDNI